MKMLKTLLLLALLAVVCAGLNGCAFRRVMRYADAEKYTVGDAVLTGPVENVEIDWLSGSGRCVLDLSTTSGGIRLYEYR